MRLLEVQDDLCEYEYEYSRDLIYQRKVVTAVEFNPQKRTIKYGDIKYVLDFPFCQFYLVNVNILYRNSKVVSDKTTYLHLTGSWNSAQSIKDIFALPLPNAKRNGYICCSLKNEQTKDIKLAITQFWNSTFSYFLDANPFNFYHWTKGKLIPEDLDHRNIARKLDGQAVEPIYGYVKYEI
jgi:hypothetical protein